jgi:hypothetical protein
VASAVSCRLPLLSCGSVPSECKGLGVDEAVGVEKYFFGEKLSSSHQGLPYERDEIYPAFISRSTNDGDSARSARP